MLVAKKNVLYEILNAANTENIYLNGRMCQPNTDALLWNAGYNTTISRYIALEAHTI
jgi:hypothetical protein